MVTDIWMSQNYLMSGFDWRFVTSDLNAKQYKNVQLWQARYTQQLTTIPVFII